MKTHPGQILAKEFVEPHGLSYYRLSKASGIPASRLYEIAAGNRSVSADTALRLSRTFSTTPEFWMNLQTAYDLAKASKANGKHYRKIKPL